MPRASTASKSIVQVLPDANKRRLRAPDDLQPEARRVWSEVVDTLPPDRFHASERPLLALYCRSMVTAERALTAIDRDGPLIGDKINPALRLFDTSVRQVVSLATKLRVTPQSRVDRKVAGTSAREDASASRPWHTTDGPEGR